MRASSAYVYYNRGVRRKLRLPTFWVCKIGISSPKRRVARGVWGHFPPDFFEILILWNAISSVLSGQFLPKVLAKSIVIFMLFLFGWLFAWLFEQIVDFILYFGGFWSFLDIRISKVYSWSFRYHKIFHGSIRTDVKIGIFPIPIAYWSVFKIFKQNLQWGTKVLRLFWTVDIPIPSPCVPPPPPPKTNVLF